MKKSLIFIIIAIILIIVVGIVGVILFYNTSLKAVSTESSPVTIEIKSGSTATDIAQTLKENGLIKNSLVFKLYTKLNNVNGMQAGTYKLDKNMNVEEIADALQKGTDYFPDELKITFLEGKNMRWIAKTIADNTNNTEDDVYTKLADKPYIESLIQKYWFLTEDVLDENIYYPLEGYLFPDTYSFKNKDVTVDEIFTSMLDEMQKKLEDFKDEIQDSGYSVHKILTISSIVECEASKVEDRAGVASVIYNRLKNNLSIGSDVTTYYAIKVDMSERDLYQSELNKYNPYNTRGPQMNGKLPIGPISTVSIDSIKAALEPENTDNLYFVADKNGKIYFAKTEQGHNENINNLKMQGLWYNYE